MAQMIADFNFSEEAAWNDLAIARAFAYSAWQTEAKAMVTVRRVTDGYIAMEAAR